MAFKVQGVGLWLRVWGRVGFENVNSTPLSCPCKHRIIVARPPKSCLGY